MIEAASVSFRVGNKALLENVSLSVRAGETAALVGPNGAGKSTLLRTLSGEIAPSSGTVLLKGRAPRAYRPRDLAHHRAVLSQSVNVAFPFSVAEVVRMGAGERRSRTLEAAVDRALAEVEMLDFRDRIIGTLSGGEQQRVHFARVMVQLACGEAEHGPGLLLLDEPTASLDLRHQLDIVTVARRCAARGMAVIAILHDLNLAALFADRIVVLHGGRLVGEGPPDQILTDRVLEQVFGVRAAVNLTPPQGMPFVLPQGASKS